MKSTKIRVKCKVSHLCDRSLWYNDSNNILSHSHWIAHFTFKIQLKHVLILFITYKLYIYKLRFVSNIYANLNKCFLRFLRIISLINAALIWFSKLVYSPWTDAMKDFSMFIAIWLFGNVKSEQYSGRSILTGLFFWIRLPKYSSADPLNILNVPNSIIYSDLKNIML